MRELAVLIIFSLSWAFLAGCAAQPGDGGSTVREESPGMSSPEAPPPPRLEPAPAPREGYVWTTGHWKYVDGRWEWAAGYWQRNRSGRRWVDGRWESRGDRFDWIEGHWE